SIDGGVAVAATAQYPDDVVYRFLSESTERLAQYRADLRDERRDVLLVRTCLPQDSVVELVELPQTEGLHQRWRLEPQPRGIGNSIYVTRIAERQCPRL